MSKFGKQGRRCDTCGKFANNRMGEYVKKDGSCGYIWPESSMIDGAPDDRHMCEECYEEWKSPAKEVK